MRRRLAAIVALVAGAATIALALALAVSEFPRGLGLLGCVLVAGGAAWYGVLRRGIARVARLTVAGLALAGAVALLLAVGPRIAELLVLAGLLVALAAARGTPAVHVDLPSASAPRRPVLFFNPRSGGGKAERFSLAAEARARGIEPIGLKPGDDLETLVLDPPLCFRIRPGVLRVRVARKHPGASPSAMAPEGVWAGVRELARVALARDQKTATSVPGRPEWT